MTLYIETEREAGLGCNGKGKSHELTKFFEMHIIEITFPFQPCWIWTPR